MTTSQGRHEEYRPLEDLTVVELSHMVAAPLAGQLLRAHGARVIKVESPSGDFARKLGPKHQSGHSILFTFVNSGKEMVELDLKTPQGVEDLWRLLEEADVFISNFRGTALSRMGIDTETLRRDFPALVIGIISGSYLDSDDSPAVDITALARSGFLMLDRLDDSLQRPNVPIVDLMSGLVLAMEILASTSSDRSQGRVINVPLQDSAFFLNSLAMAASESFVEEGLPPRNTSAFGLSLLAEASDGWIGFAAPTDVLFEKFSQAMNREDWVVRFPSAEDRRLMGEVLVGEIRQELKKYSAQGVVSELQKLDVPSEVVQSCREAANDPYLIESGLVGESEQSGLVSMLPLLVDGRRIRLDGERHGISP
jgi:CoA:oxalate CoA-transferase